MRIGKIDPAAVAVAADALEDYVLTAYSGYESGLRGGEPNISVGECAGYLRQHAVGVGCPYLDEGPDRKWATRWFSQLADAALRRLVRAGRLGTSLGAGRGGRETRLYEPGPRRRR